MQHSEAAYGGDWSGGRGLEQVSVSEQLIDDALLLPRATSPHDALLLLRSSPEELDPLEAGRRVLQGDMTGDRVPAGEAGGR